MSDINRRDFVRATVALACLGCACDVLSAATTAPAGSPSGGKTVDVGPLADFSKDGVSDKWAKNEKFFIIRQDGKLYASSSVCTHRRTILKVKDGEIVCPAHGSHFSGQGVPTKGPAKYPLYRYAISQNDAEHVIVDKSKQFEEKDWENERAFIKLD